MTAAIVIVIIILMIPIVIFILDGHMKTMMKNQRPGDGCDHNSHDHNDDDDYQHENGEEGPIVFRGLLPKSATC